MPVVELRCHVGVGPRVSGTALVTDDNFSARYDLDRIKGIFSRPQHKLAGESYVDCILVVNTAKGGVASAWMLHEMASRQMAPKAILFNNAKCRAWSPDYVNTASGLDLHQCKWLDDEAAIGEIPLSWNHLVGEYAFDARAANVHYTLGGPYFDDYRDSEYADDWFGARDALLHVRRKKSRTPEAA